MTQFKGTPWSVEVSEPEYLDGITSGVMVHDDNRRPVAYAFDEVEGRVLAAAPALLEALSSLLEANSFYFKEGNPWGDRARAAIAKALGGDA